MPIMIIPASTFYGSSGGASADGHTHTNSATLNKLSTNSNGDLCFNGKIVGEKAVETAYNVILNTQDISRKYIALPHDCDTSHIITLSLNGVSFAQGDFWEVSENVNSTSNDLITWEGLGLDSLVQAGDTVLISYYKKL